jgi:hypothetical protein
MASFIRKIPPACFLVSLVKLMFGKLRYSKEYDGKRIKMKNGGTYTIFRHVERHPRVSDKEAVIFIARFKFARLSFRANRFISQIPMLLITGFPGFQAKMYTINKENGYWQGIYQWESERALEEYKKSFVLRMMNKRAVTRTVSYFQRSGKSMDEFIEELITS